MLKAYLAVLKYPPARRSLLLSRLNFSRMCHQHRRFVDIGSLSRAIYADLFIDIGCHTGNSLMRFLDEGGNYQVAAFDPISTNLDEAHRHLARYSRVTF